MKKPVSNQSVAKPESHTPKKQPTKPAAENVRNLRARPRKPTKDKVQEASEESFPASDPPAFTPGKAS